MLIELSLNDQKVKEYNQIVRENQKAYPDLNFREVKTLENIFLPYSKLLDSSELDDYIQIQKDYRNGKEFRGIYMCVLGSNNTIAQLTDYKEVLNLESPIYRQGYGVADNASQVLDYYEKLCKEYKEYTKDRDFVILMTPIFRENEPERQGWRWHKWGDYIGKFEPKCEYLQEEEGIDFVWVFHVIELAEEQKQA